jgi:hypothetical protein
VNGRCRGGFCLGAGLIDDDVPIIASVGLGSTRHVQATDEYVEHVTHGGTYEPVLLPKTQSI